MEKAFDRPSGHEDLDQKVQADPFIARDVNIQEVLDLEYTPEDEKRVVRKLDLVFLPIFLITYGLQYLDKVALSQATLLNLREDLNLQGQEYSWTSSIFYFGYFAWSWPSSYLMVRLPLAKYMGVSVLIWGGILMCHAATKGFSGLMAARFFLGAGEAVIGPGFALSIGMFYTREEQPTRQAAWFIGNGISNLVSGLIAYGIGNITLTSITNWQLLFLILGAVTVVVGTVIFIIIPDKPQKAIFLTKTERAIAIQRTIKNKTGVNDSGRWRWNQVWLTLRDPQTWCLFLYSISTNLANGGITSFSGLIINGFGYGRVQSLLLQMPLGVAQLLFIFLTTGFVTFFPNTRTLMMIFNTSISVMGMALVWKLDESHSEGRVAALALSAVFAANTPLSLSLVSSNVAGFTKRSVTSAFIFIGYCVGNIAGPQFFFEREEPGYQTGMTASVAGLSFGVFFLILLLAYYSYENKRRDRVYGPAGGFSESEEVAQGLSNKTDLEIPSFRYVL
ncbi:major facilitator superfamily domain-containing protein [Aspergillus karnatakaensis]|uniref:major facilitator superfamily domain-containing protein n=1 Tax=Aspergillus karnatakaensis TaxID=1810916 RepID=UPI003CCCC877